MAIEITVLIAVIGCALSVGTFFVGRMTAAKSSGQEDGEMRANVRYIRESVDKHDRKLDRVVENYEALKREVVELRGRLDMVEQRMEMLHKEDNI